MDAVGEPLAGYKIGATSPQAQSIIGCSEPIYGPIPQSAVSASASTIRLPEGTLGAECEFAFQLARDIVPRTTPYTVNEVSAAIGQCCPAIEIIGRRTAGSGFPPYLMCVADFGLNAFFIHGPAIAGWRDADLAGAAVTALVDGVATNRGTGAAVLGHPLNAATWLANKLSAENLVLSAGAWISTGTCLGVVTAGPGQTVVGDFGALGQVVAHLAP